MADIVTTSVDILVLLVRFAIIDVLHRIHKNPMVVTDVYGIATGAPGVAVVPCRHKIGALPQSGDSSVVVVVAGYRIERSRITRRCQKLLCGILIHTEVIPVTVMGEIAQID